MSKLNNLNASENDDEIQGAQGAGAQDGEVRRFCEVVVRPFA
ncbi:MAG TPA: hypothetical protein VLI42_07965 [Chthoniobacterales bacterium]|jgi:hypothetical protein|nr:hypothetical protein [Chthoniobacterales bacterium]